MKIDPEILYQELRVLSQTVPELRESSSISADAHQWLGRLGARVRSLGEPTLTLKLDKAMEQLTKRDRSTSSYEGRAAGAASVSMVLYQALAQAELEAPAVSRGGFLPAGSALDAMKLIGEILAKGADEVLIVDPYMDDKLLTDFCLMAQAGVKLRLLTDQASVKPIFRPAVSRWITQYGTNRPLEARLASPKHLHDRLIVIDRASVWVVTQSFKDLAVRAPASIVMVDAETAGLKVVAYNEIWDAAEEI